MERQRQIARIDRSPVRFAVAAEDDGLGERQRENSNHQRQRGGVFRQHDRELPNRRREQQLQRFRSPLLGEGAHGQNGHQQDRQHVHLVKNILEVRYLGDEQRQAERIAEHEQEHGRDRVADRRRQRRVQLLGEQDAQRSHVSDKNQLSRSGVSAIARTPSNRPSSITATRSEIFSTSLRICELMSTVWRPASERISSLISMIWRGSSPLVGSSRMRMSGSWISAWASAARWR